MSKKKENNYVHTEKGTEIISHNLAKKFGVLEQMYLNAKLLDFHILKNKYHTIRRANQAKKDKEKNQGKLQSKYQYKFTVVKLEYFKSSYRVEFKELEDGHY